MELMTETGRQKFICLLKNNKIWKQNIPLQSKGLKPVDNTVLDYFFTNFFFKIPTAVSICKM